MQVTEKAGSYGKDSDDTLKLTLELDAAIKSNRPDGQESFLLNAQHILLLVPKVMLHIWEFPKQNRKLNHSQFILSRFISEMHQLN